MRAGDIKTASILIVDDQSANIELLEAFLTDAGYTQLTSTTDPRLAVELCGDAEPDLILLDLHMPHLDGFAVMRALEPIISKHNYLPILMLTADITPEIKQRALADGAKDFLSKPLDEVETLLRIKNLLETRALHLEIEERNHALERTVQELAEEREVSERLLLNVLPKSIADRLKREQGAIADSFPEATVLFADIADFTALSSQLAPEDVVAWLGNLFSTIDRLADRHRLEKIKTIGDCYMVVGGLPTSQPDHVEAIANFALDLRDEIARASTPTGDPLRMRIGAHTGPVVAGVIGTHKFTYDLWGDTVNTASRMLSHGRDGEIQVTAEIYERLREHYLFKERGEIEVKGKGAVRTYLLIGKTTNGSK